MFKNYLKVAFRHFTKNQSFSLINLFGLAVGLAAAIAVFLYVQDELSYESHHEKAAQIVRVNIEANFDGEAFKLGTTPNRIAPFLKEQLPEIKEALRVFPHNFGESASVRVANENFVEPKLYWADPNLFEVLTLPLIDGDPKTALDRTNTVIISESSAKRFFGTENPIGKTLEIDSRHKMEVTGVFKDMPANTHLPFNVIGAFQTINFGKPERLSWGNASFYTFLLLNQGTDIAALEDKVQAAAEKGIPVDNRWFELRLKPFLDIHLYSKGFMDSKINYGDINQIYLLSGLALILMLIACINYMNLATAKSQQRSKEVAVNKTLGATTKQMAAQFFTETALLTLIGLVLSGFILALTLPYFNNITDKQLSIALLLQPQFIFGLMGIWLVLTLIAGSYPALFLSSFSPIHVLRQQKEQGFGAGSIRKGLVIFQFSVSIILIVSTLILFQQLNFISNKKLGYDPEQVVAVRVLGVRPAKNIETLEKELAQLPSVLGTALSQSYPGHSASGRTLTRQDDTDGQGADLTSCRAYPGIFDVLDLKLLAGRPVKKMEKGDSITQVVLNKSAIDYLGYTPEEAIGKRVNANLGISEIVGVTEDFHFGSLHSKIGNYAFHNRNSEWLQYLLIKLNTNDLASSLKHIKNTFQKVSPTTAFEYSFLDASLEKLYKTEQRLAKVVFIFAGLAILIACLGLFALAAFATERRTKEIGIRKILGASAGNLVGLLSLDFLKLVAIAFLLAAPLAWYAMNQWLQDFAYRIEIQWWVFAVAGLMAVMIAFFTVSFHSLKAAWRNPITSLKVE
jgi:putative ABC transport system permease protein